MKDWDADEARATGALILSGRFVDDPIKEKSRYCAREFATTKDPTVFAAASDVNNSAIIDLLAVKKGYPILVFDAVAAFSQAEEQELVFLQPPVEYQVTCKKPVLWQCLKVREGRRNGARSWQDHFHECLTDEACPGRFKRNMKTASLYHSKELDVTIDIHVDDGYAVGESESLEKVFAYLSSKLVLKVSSMIKPGMGFDHVGASRFRTDDGMWIQPFSKYVERALEIMGMEKCNASKRPKLDKANMEGDDEPYDRPQLYKSTTCTLLYAAKRQPESQSTVRWLCKRLANPTNKSGRQLVKLLRYLKGQPDLATFFPVEGKVDHIEGFLDGDWACDEFDRKSVSGGLAMVGGCRIHSHSRGTTDHALSSGESEVMALSELKECMLIQYSLEFVGFGKVPIVMYTDATVARAFAHRTGVGRLKHLDVRYMWVQEQLSRGAYALKKIPRAENPADVLTHSPSSQELEKFKPMMGLFPMECSKGAVEMTRAVLRQQPSFAPKLAALIFAAAAKGARGDEMIKEEVGWIFFDLARMIVCLCGFWQIFRWMWRWLRPTAMASTPATGGASPRVIADATVHEQQRRRHVAEASRIYIKEKGYAYHTHADCPTLQTRSSTMMRSLCRACEARAPQPATQ